MKIPLCIGKHSHVFRPPGLRKSDESFASKIILFSECKGRRTNVRGSRFRDALRNVCLPVGLSRGITIPATPQAAKESAFARVCARAHLSLPNVLACKEIQVHDSDVTPLLLPSFCLPHIHTNTHFQRILSTVFHPISALMTFCKKKVNGL